MAVVTRSSQKKNEAKTLIANKRRCDFSLQVGLKRNKKISSGFKKRKAAHVMKPSDHNTIPFTRRSKNRQSAQKNKVAIIEQATKKIEEINDLIEDMGSKFSKRILKRNFTMKQSLSYFTKCFSPYVKWHKVYTYEDSLPSISKIPENEENVKYQMYLCNVPWLHVAKSKQNRGYGLFTSRVFLNDDYIGIYYGYKQNTIQSEYRLKDIDTTGIKDKLLFGCHFINDPYFGMNKESGKFKDGTFPKEDPNSKFCTDYLIQATRKIEKNEEILAWYNWDDKES